MAKKVKALPATIYSYIEEDGDDEFLVASVSPDEIPADRDGIVVGKYCLQEKRKFTVTKRKFTVTKTFS